MPRLTKAFEKGKPCEKEQSLSRCATAPFTQGSRRQQTAVGYGRDAEGNKLRTVIQRSRTYQAATSYVRTPISVKTRCFPKKTARKAFGKSVLRAVVTDCIFTVRVAVLS